MRGYATLCALCCVLAAGGILASGPQRPPPMLGIEPYVSVSVSTTDLHLGTIQQPGPYDSPATLTVQVEANIPHGGLMAQAGPLQGPKGWLIPPERLFVRIPETGQYVSMKGPVDITGPMGPGRFEFPVMFRMQTDWGDPAGTYTGTCVFTCVWGGPGRRK